MSNPTQYRILPPVYLGGAVLGMVALHFLLPGPQWSGLVAQIAGGWALYQCADLVVTAPGVLRNPRMSGPGERDRRVWVVSGRRRLRTAIGQKRTSAHRFRSRVTTAIGAMACALTLRLRGAGRPRSYCSGRPALRSPERICASACCQYAGSSDIRSVRNRAIV